MSSKADQTQLNEIHGLLTGKIKEILLSEGPLPAASITAISKFLSDNGISCDLGVLRATLQKEQREATGVGALSLEDNIPFPVKKQA